MWHNVFSGWFKHTIGQQVDFAHLAGYLSRVPASSLGKAFEHNPPCARGLYQGLVGLERVHDVTGAAHPFLDGSAEKLLMNSESQRAECSANKGSGYCCGSHCTATSSICAGIHLDHVDLPMRCYQDHVEVQTGFMRNRKGALSKRAFQDQQCHCQVINDQGTEPYVYPSPLGSSAGMKDRAWTSGRSMTHLALQASMRFPAWYAPIITLLYPRHASLRRSCVQHLQPACSSKAAMSSPLCATCIKSAHIADIV